MMSPLTQMSCGTTPPNHLTEESRNPLDSRRNPKYKKQYRRLSEQRSESDFGREMYEETPFLQQSIRRHMPYKSSKEAHFVNIARNQIEIFFIEIA